MALNEHRSWLIAYDIAHPKRLGRIHRYTKSVATPMQYSLYVCFETVRGIQGIRDTLATMINAREDDVRIYQLPQRLNIARYGRRPLPEGLLIAEAKSLTQVCTKPLVGDRAGKDYNLGTTR